MTAQNKKYLGISILFILMGAFKIYMKGLYLENGEISWFKLLVPFGLGIIALIVVVTKILIEKKQVN